ncbi:MAG: hypothetical protein H6813_06245 [Phycisphaeraceae bacterium]|nr:hypothetical protein [Phycisphaeraceae bacterium]MCB9848071.1 hypothetical protein [Phycisphaeraceae bacterium]
MESIDALLALIKNGFTYRPTDPPLIESIVTSLNTKRTATAQLVRSRVKFVNKVELVLVFNKKSYLAYACAVRPGRGSTGLAGARLFLPVSLNIPVSQIREGLPIELRDDFDNLVLSRSASRPRTDLWVAILKAAHGAAGESQQEFEQLLRLIATPVLDIEVPGASAVLAQRDQLGIALDIAEIDGGDILPQAQGVVGRLSDLGSLAQIINQRPLEEPAIFQDSRQWPGFDAIDATTDSARFQSESTTLDVFVTHRQSFERQHGSDLLYYNHKYESLVLVQYKMYDANGEFRPDSQSRDEENRLGDFRSFCDIDPSISRPISDYRLGVESCYFKMLKRQSIDTRTDQLVWGQYIPLWLWEGLWGDDVTSGPRGGRVLCCNKVPRHMCRTSFVGLVSNGWIGTHAIDARRVFNYIKDRAEDGASVMMAVSSSVDNDDGDRSDDEARLDN